MSDTIRIKRRAAGGAAGAPSSLQNAELAYNEQDNTLYYGVGTGGTGGSATTIIPIAGPGAFCDLTSAQTVAGLKAFTTTPTAPTASPGDNTTKLATTAFVQTALGGVGGSQAANTVYAGPTSGGNAAPTYRLLVSADIPSIVGASKLSDYNAANGVCPLDSGSKVPIANLPSSVTSGLRFVATLAATGSLPASPSNGQYWIISTAGTFTGTSVALQVGDWIIYDNDASGDLAVGWDYIQSTAAVASVFGRVGTVTAQSGDYTTALVTEVTNLYFTAARVLATVLTGLSTATSTVVAATDSILVAIGKLQAQVTLRLIASNNLSDLASAATARTNLGLGSAALLASSAVAQTANNLSDLASAATARTNLGLGSAAVLTSAQVAQTANNLSDLASAPTARTNLGLGTMATQAASAVAITGGTIDNVTFDGGTF